MDYLSPFISSNLISVVKQLLQNPDTTTIPNGCCIRAQDFLMNEEVAIQKRQEIEDPQFRYKVRDQSPIWKHFSKLQFNVDIIPYEIPVAFRVLDYDHTKDQSIVKVRIVFEPHLAMKLSGSFNRINQEFENEEEAKIVYWIQNKTLSSSTYPSELSKTVANYVASSQEDLAIIFQCDEEDVDIQVLDAVSIEIPQDYQKPCARTKLEIETELKNLLNKRG